MPALQALSLTTSRTGSLSTLKTADKVVYMEDGVVAEQGSYDELAREGTRFNHLIRSQLLGGPPPTTTRPPAGEPVPS